MDYTPLTIMGDYNTSYNIGYWLIPALLAVWAIVMIVKKIMRGIKDTKEMDKKIRELDREKEKEKNGNNEDNEAEAELRGLKEESRKLAEKIEKLEQKTRKKSK